MSLATGSLVFLGFLLLVLGAASKFLGFSLLTPLIIGNTAYLIAANTCFLVAIIVDRFQKG